MAIFENFDLRFRLWFEIYLKWGTLSEPRGWARWPICDDIQISGVEFGLIYI